MRTFLLTFCALAALPAQDNMPRPQPFDSELKTYLSLTDDQLVKIQANNRALEQRTSERSARNFTLSREIFAELAKPSPDAMAVGMRSAELENDCRATLRLTAQTREQNVALLTAAQKARLQTLEEAVRMSAVISEAQSANLYRTSLSSFASFLLGSVTTIPIPNGIVAIPPTIFRPVGRSCGSGLLSPSSILAIPTVIP